MTGGQDTLEGVVELRNTNTSATGLPSDSTPPLSGYPATAKSSGTSALPHVSCATTEALDRLHLGCEAVTWYLPGHTF
eukprot:CAMPEP_0114324442 /NCGR_PEP_ID=MMETSP0059-20121206/28510_1 /TAXON_ID=36894 /ORGANISM="Pyramimonas parkeae, Strain CCMP726" /LENGTH=77 /DNA_ID=CAMNT_0001452983 /DNA_START=20 /DNA_END=250 /DNA_ORIENTATION=+